jgi:hypothetical protein
MKSTVIAGIVLTAGCLAASGVAWPHGPAAWIMNGPYYAILTGQPDVHCCGPSDCEMWPEDDVSVEPDGYHLKSTGEVIPYDKAFFTEADQVQRSRFWRCHTYEVLPQFQQMAPQTGLFGPVHPSHHYKARCFFGPAGAV